MVPRKALWISIFQVILPETVEKIFFILFIYLFKLQIGFYLVAVRLQ
jgi:hypothetical protein